MSALFEIGQFVNGWRRQQPDFRDRAYYAPAPPSAPLPRKVSVRRKFTKAPWVPTWNQGPLGSCGPHTALADLVFALFLAGHDAPPMPSRLATYWWTRKLMGTVNSDSGVDNRSLVKSLAVYGWCDEALCPYDVSRFRNEPSRECHDQAAGRRVSEYLAVPQTLDGIKSALANDDPFIFGFSVYSSMFSAEVARTGRVPMPSRRDSLAGGHDVLVTGVDEDAGVLEFRNSWLNGSAPWGDDGYGTIPLEYALNPNLAGDWWTVRGTGLPKPTPPAPPAPPPVPAQNGRVLVDVDRKLVTVPRGWHAEYEG